ncbi:hypothetical protein LUZ60_009871 [Juncus effusus]|nr:hypothetical protein LUZ60_009871 [Juncus effusus]
MPAFSIFLLRFFAIQTILVHGCFQHEREALLKFKAGLNDPSGLLVSWRGEECCTWAGIKCSNQTGHVVKLNLFTPYPCETTAELCFIADEVHRSFGNSWSNTSFSGEIPQKIAALLGLRNLNLSYNKLDGAIPEEIGNMQSLESLDFRANRMFLLKREDQF